MGESPLLVRLACSIVGPFALVVALTAEASALEFRLDYGYDTQGYFAANPAARAALELAAHDLGALVTTRLGAVNTDLFSGTSQGTTMKFDWTLTVKRPVTGTDAVFPTFTADANTVVLHVGFRNLPGTTLSGMSSDLLTQVPIVTAPGAGTVAAEGLAEGASNAAMTRGGGPTLGSYSVSFGGGGYVLRYGVFGASLWFDDEMARWQFDATQPVATGKFDFYTVALRSMMQSLGFGGSETFLTLTQNTTWTGSHVAALFGGDGSNLVTLTHEIASQLQGESLFDGSMQNALMTPDLAAGERRHLTTLDAAFLMDLNYTVPEPGSATLLICGGLMVTARRNRGRVAQAQVR